MESGLWYGTDSQTANGLALFPFGGEDFQLDGSLASDGLPSGTTGAAVTHVIKNRLYDVNILSQSDAHLNFGLIGAKFVLETLSSESCICPFLFLCAFR